MEKISVLILTYQCERTLKRTLESVKDFDEIILFDSGSSDATRDIFEEYACDPRYSSRFHFIVHPFTGGFAEQRNRAIESASYRWCLFVDSDEEVSLELRRALYSVDGKYPLYRIFRTEYLMGEEISQGLGASGYQERFFDRLRTRYEGEVHEYPLVDGVKPSEKTAIDLDPQARLHHDPDNDISMMVAKMGRYSLLKAKEKVELGQKTSLFEIYWTFTAIFLKTFFLGKSYRMGRRGFILCILEAIHRVFVRLLVYEEQLRQEKK